MNKHKSPPAARARGQAAIAVALGVVFVGLTACEQTRPVAPAPAASPFAASPGAAGGGAAIPGGAFASFDGETCGLTDLPPGVSSDVGPFPGYGTWSLSTTGYPIFDIGPLPGGQPSYAYDVNDASPAQVVGGSQQPEGWRAFAWTEPGGFTNLGTLPGGNESFAHGNNNLNQVVGYSTSSSGQSAFKWTSGGGMVALVGLPGGNFGDAWDINDAGQVAGWSRVNANDEHATLWSAAGVPQDLGVLPGGVRSYAYDVNNLGHVTGWSFSANGQRAFLWKPGGPMQDLGVLPGATWTRALALNDKDEVVGYALFNGTYYRGFYWSPSTGMIDIGSLGNDPTQSVIAWDINESGQVTGYSRLVGNSGAVNAFLWTRAGGMKNLGKHQYSCSSYAYGMNNTGKVSGSDEFSSLHLGHRSALWNATPPNTPPTLSNLLAVNGTCSTTPAVTFTVNDADGGAGPWSYTVSWSDGTSSTGSTSTLGVPITVQKPSPYANGSYTATVTVNDGNGGTATATKTVTYLCVGSLGDRVWYDVDGDGLQEGGEPGVAGVTLNVTGPGGFSTTVTTGSNGIYGVSNLVPGSYTVCVAASNTAAGGALAGYTETFDLVAPTTDGCATVSVAGDQNRTDVDFGYTKPTGQIGNYTWIDANGNGKQDAGEPALDGVTLTLAGVGTGTQASASGGAYLFTLLGPGSYTVTASKSGFVPTTVAAPGTNGDNDSNASPASVSLPAWNSVNLSIDFGFVPAAGSGQGCTPGYWKQDQHFDRWKWYTTTNMVNAVFGVTYASTQNNNPTGPLTLLQALQLNGNDGSEALFRHGVAALLNSVYQSGVSYPYTASQVITMVRNAWLSGSYDTMEAVHQQLETANQRTCPLN